MGVIFKVGDTAPSINLYVFDNSGAPVTGKVYTDFPTIKYSINGANNAATITLASLANENSAYSSGGIKERAGGAGCYRLDLPAAAVATAGTIVDIFGYASNFNILCPQIEVMQITTAGSLDVNLIKWKGSTPNDLVQGRLETLPFVVRSNTIQSAAGVNVVLDTGADATNNNKYRYQWILFLTGNAAGECDQIVGYTASSRTATVIKGWVNSPTTGDVYVILPQAPTAINWQTLFGAATAVNLSQTTIGNVARSGVIGSGTATGSTANSITGTGMVSDNRFVGAKLYIWTGTGTGQTRAIIAMTATAITVDRNWDIAPDNTSSYVILHDDAPAVDSSRRVSANLVAILGTMLTETVAGYIAAGFKKLFDVVSPIFTLASVNQTGDVYPVVNDPSSGNAALGALITNIKNNTFVRSTIPEVIERPDSGSKSVQMVFTYEDENGSAKNLDSGNPTISLVNDDSTDLSNRLGTWSNPATGKYCINYVSSASDPVEGLHWDVTGTVNSKLRRYVAYMQVVDTTAVSFSSTDRANLNSVLTHATNADNQTVASAIRSAVGLATANLDTQLSGIGTAVWGTMTSAISTVGSIGLQLKNFVMSYVAAPTAGDIAGEVADTLFQDGAANKLKVNSDRTVIQNTIKMDAHDQKKILHFVVKIEDQSDSQEIQAASFQVEPMRRTVPSNAQTAKDRRADARDTPIASAIFALVVAILTCLR